MSAFSEPTQPQQIGSPTFIDLLNRYWPKGGKATADYLKLSAFIDGHLDTAFNNDEYNDGHITGSAFVYDPIRRKLLLMHHKKLNRWLQPGGHSDGSPDVLSTAKREVEEETGVVNFETNGEIFDIDVHTIPAKESKHPEHLHYDVRFLLIADSSLPLTRNTEESNDLLWIDIDNIWEYVSPNDEAFVRVVEQLNHYNFN